VSAGFLVAAAIMAFSVDRFLNGATHTTGVVVALIEKRDTERNLTTYAPVFTFTTEDGGTQSVTSSVATNPPGFAVGDQVRILYLRSDPAGARIDSFWQLWFWPIFLLGFGSVEILAGIIFLFVSRRKLRKQGSLLAA